MAERHVVVIVGAGPGGLAAGVQAARRQIPHVLLERAELGNTVHRYQKGKLVMAEPARLSLQQDLELAFEEGAREEVLAAWAEGVEAAGVNLLRGPEYDVQEIAGSAGEFVVRTRSGQSFETESILIAIGMQGNLRTFRVEGDDLPHVTYQLDDPGAFTDKRIVVVGAGDAGIENALALVEHDNEVAIVNRRDEFDRVKARNRMLILSAIKSGEIKLYANSTVKRFEPGAVILNTDQGEVHLDVDLVIGRLGALPPRQFLESIGIRFPSDDKEAVPIVNDRFESNVPGVYLVGAIIGRPLIKACMNGGYEAIEYILGNEVINADEPLLAQLLGPIPRATVGVSEGASDTEFVSAVVARIRDSLPPFAPLTPIQLRELLLDSRIHRIAPADGEHILYEEGDFSNTLFSILDGGVEVRVPIPDREGVMQVQTVSIGAGEFVGEGGLLTGRPRNATVAVRTDSILIETARFAMNKVIRDNPQVEQVINAAAVERALSNLLPEIDDGERRRIAGSAELRRYQSGQTLFELGDDPDGLHLLRRGSVSISLPRPSGEDGIVSIVGAGTTIGEVALLQPDGKRTATIKALVFTETIMIPADAAKAVIAQTPELREKLGRRALEFVAADAVPPSDLYSQVVLGSGVREATDLLVIDESLCIRCNNCEKACAETHGGVSRLDREAGPRFAQVHIPNACLHCENPKCMTDCPPRCIHRDPRGMVYIETSECISCGNCVSYCPYNAIKLASPSEAPRPNLLLGLFFGERKPQPGEQAGSKHVALKCDMCREVDLPRRPDGGKGVACVQGCPTGAIVRVAPSALMEQIIEGAG